MFEIMSIAMSKSIGSMLGIVTQSLAKYGTIFIFVSEIFLLLKYFLEKQL